MNGAILLTSGVIAISDDRTISGPGASRPTVSGNGSSRDFRLDSTTPKNVTINAMTITGAARRATAAPS